MDDVDSAGSIELPVSLPSRPGYDELLGVPAAVLDELRSLRSAALDGQIGIDAWDSRHAATLAELSSFSIKDLERLVTSVRRAIDDAGQDFDRFLFLTALLADLRLLQRPEPDRELRDLAEQLPGAGGDQRARVLSQIAVLRGTDPEASRSYDPTGRMVQALRVGTLEVTYRWLREAVAANPGSSVQDLLTRAALEVAEAKLELDRYDDLNSRAG